MRIIAFTGAGMSKDSGLDTFRQGGLWDGLDVREVAYVDRWWKGDDARQKMLDFYNGRRRECRQAMPNAGHVAFAELESEGHSVTVITQNIDDLHERAGSSDVIHLHGEIMKVRPDDAPDHLIPWFEDCNLGDLHQGVQLRPHVVWFGEGLPELDRALEVATAAAVDALVVVGTTLAVGPANLCAFCTRARTVVLVDPEPPEFGIIDFEGYREYRDFKPHPHVIEVREGAAVGVPRALRELVSA